MSRRSTTLLSTSPGSCGGRTPASDLKHSSGISQTGWSVGCRGRSSSFATSSRCILLALHSLGPTCTYRHVWRSEEHTSELQSRLHLVCRLLLEKKKKTI